MIKIDTIEEFDKVVGENKSFFILKHSLTCPISQAAFTEYEKFANGQIEFPTYYLAVQDSRSLSNEIAERFNIKHESPQVLLFANKNVVWHESHWKITNESILNAVEKSK